MHRVPLNIIGVRVWEDRCQLVARNRFGEWEPFGAARPLPVFVPQDPRGIQSDPLLLTVYQYDRERPGSDLVAVLAGKKRFDEALLYDVDVDGAGNEAAR